ncbi:DNA gyrase subunit A [Desulfuromonas acetoxidans]|uniref:DNA gyrase subunit A n=1 Tax=Desulfuromonas acetoxidans (strain DSM 684 / 11070) TaxID=281689 RepID=Q1JZE9_DESA6|nr:DNA gyrase subunit A [Desulfuromonas acetoxidans]EAT15618.1 DNA gyrase, A subunit [Desulfuromonas acetoxidans DSM 684]MBF0645755.1 DNA gyrase subunit A [Desulfuromonas acetoxidans]NVD25211.1 DNA gyrase subunit A [Desulfuromonas acetoxidans]NVE17167.1 DNA gyrase subunit A [Desulfuromonas acetoxidans]
MLSQQNKVSVNIENEMRKSYMDYAMSVIIGRALPDIRDGLKPVHRRVLFAMHELGNEYNKPYKKSARVVGDVIGKYHPHGDSAVYDTIVRMAQSFSMRNPLVDGQGNFGSIDGDSAAAMRYTEVRMAKLSHELLADIEKETVDFGPNYDDSLSEPIVLPCKFPNLLVNGSEGIAVGMATKIPPHNLGEVINGLVSIIDDPTLTFEDLIQIIPGPDFPTAGFILGHEDVQEAYRTGRGIIQMRAKAMVEIDRRTSRESIVINEIPYQVNKAKLIEKIANLIKEKKIEGISDLRDESDRDGMRIVIDLKREAVAGVVLNQLYKMTAMQSSFGIIMLAIVGGQPKILTLREVLDQFIDHRKEIVTRRCVFELKKAEARAHILEGLKIALENLDELIQIIKTSANSQEAKARLIERFTFSDIQAQAILDMRLHRLTGLERDKIINEYNEVLAQIARLKEILGSEVEILKIIRAELIEVKENYDDPRRTEIIAKTKDLSIEDLIVEEDMVVTVSHSGYIKRNAVSLYRSQRRGGKGKTGMRPKEEDFVEKLFIASTHSYILVFTDQGKVYWLKVHEIPQGGRAARGKAIVNLLQLAPEERVMTILPVKEFVEDKYIIAATKNGVVKKTELMAYANPRQGGIISMTIDEGDSLVATRITDGSMDVLLASHHGKSIRFAETDVRPMGRTARGVRGMQLEGDDTIIGMEVVNDNTSASLVSVTENGYGKRTNLSEYRVQSRSGKGIITIKTSDRNGYVVDIKLVTDEEDLMFITDRGKILRTRVGSLSIIGRNTQGVRLMVLEDDERIVAVAKLAEKEEELPQELIENDSEEEPAADQEDE